MSLIEHLSAGAGIFVYHWLVLLALAAMGGIAFIEWRHTGNEDQRRILLAFCALVAFRLPLLYLEARLNEPDVPGILAPVLNSLETVSLVVLGWAFLAPATSRRFNWVYLSASTGLTLVWAIACLRPWSNQLAQDPQYPYAAFWQQTVWYVVDGAACVLPITLLYRQPDGDTSRLPVLGFATLCLGFTILGLGSFALVVDWWGVNGLSLIGGGRLVNLVGYPLFGLATYRAAMVDMAAHRRRLETESEEALRRARQLSILIEIGRGLGSSLDLYPALQRTAERITKALEADRCAIFLVESTHPGKLHLAAHHPVPGSDPVQTEDGKPVSLANHPTLDHAIRRRQQLTLEVEKDHPHLKALYAALGCRGTGPTIVQPFLHQRRVLGILIVGNDRCHRGFAVPEKQLCESIAVQISALLDSARLYQGLRTQADRLAELLKEQEEEIRGREAILESIAEGVIANDEEGSVTEVNAAAEAILGIDRQQVLGRSLDHLTDDVLPTSLANWAAVIASNEPLRTVLELDGRIVQISAAPVITAAGDRRGLVTILRDITQETAEERTKSEFITAIAQELRTPITAIRGYAEALTGGLVGTVGETQAHLITVIRDNALRMANLADNLIAVAQIEKGLIRLEYGETDLRPIIQDVVLSFRGQLEPRQLNVVLDLADDLPVIEADPARVRQILANLVSNAIKFTYPGGTITIGAGLLRDGDGLGRTHCAISVKDTGIGISAEEKAHIWERFHRPANPLAAETSGLGVGLSIVKSLVEAHSGRVWLESTLGEGSCFTIVLPVTRATGA